MRENKRKLNKLRVGILLLIVIILVTISVFGRYIYNSARDSYLASRNFYFTSNLLELNGVQYNFNNWDGANVYPITFDLCSYDNKLRKVDYDLAYTLSCSPSDDTKIKCGIGSASGPTTTNGIIYKSNGNKDEVTIYVTPLEDFDLGEEISVYITASTSAPYAKTISATYSVAVSEGITEYEIVDKANQNYLNLQLVNPIDTGTTVTVAFDPSVIRLDMNDAIYPKLTAKKVDDDGYVEEITFLMEPESSRNIKFYKVDITKNYTFPNGAASSIVDITVE